MKYFVVSESELQRLKSVQYDDGFADGSDGWAAGPSERELEQAEAVCRARPVPEWGRYIVDDWGFPDKWVEVKK